MIQNWLIGKSILKWSTIGKIFTITFFHKGPIFYILGKVGNTGLVFFWAVHSFFKRVVTFLWELVSFSEKKENRFVVTDMRNQFLFCKPSFSPLTNGTFFIKRPERIFKLVGLDDFLFRRSKKISLNQWCNSSGLLYLFILKRRSDFKWTLIIFCENDQSSYFVFKGRK